MTNSIVADNNAIRDEEKMKKIVVDAVVLLLLVNA